jgi:hypothetical protein
MNAIAQVSGPLTLQPAYGRVYSSSERAVQDWIAGKDFKVAGIGGPYCSVRDEQNLRLDHSTVWIAWNYVDLVRVL